MKSFSASVLFLRAREERKEGNKRRRKCDAGRKAWRKRKRERSVKSENLRAMIYRLVDFTATIVATHPPAPTTGRTTVLQSGCGGGKDDGRGALSKRITLCGPTKTNSATDPRSDHLPLAPSRPLDRTAVNRLAFPALSLARYLHNSHGNRFSFPILRPIESNEREDRFDERESEMNETLRDGRKRRRERCETMARCFQTSRWSSRERKKRPRRGRGSRRER